MNRGLSIEYSAVPVHSDLEGGAEQIMFRLDQALVGTGV